MDIHPSLLNQNNAALFFGPAADPSTGFYFDFGFDFLVFVSPHPARPRYCLGGETTTHATSRSNLLLSIPSAMVVVLA
jgi:hypothetical protein